MVIDEMVYDPSNNSNSSSSFSVVQGVFSFVSGQVAKAGDDAMVVKTPVASIGIRGTTVAGKAAAEGSSNSITLLPDAGGGVGQIAVSNSAGTQVMSVPFQTTSLTSAFTAPPPPVVIPANQLNNLYGNIKTVLPPTPGQQKQQQQQEDNTTGPDADAGPSSESEQEQEQEQEEEEEQVEGESPEGEAEPGDGEEGDQEEEGQEGEQEQGRGEAGDAERPPSEAGPEEGEGPTDENAEGAPEADDAPLPGEGGPVGESPEQGAEDGPDGEPQQATADQPQEEQDRPNRYANASDAFEEAREQGLTEEEAFEKAASAVGATDEEKEVAEAAFQQALDEGADPREAVWRAEDAVREEFDRQRDPNRAEIEATSASIESAIQRGATAEDAFRQQISGPNISRQDVDIAREVAYQTLESAFRNDDLGGVVTLAGGFNGRDTAGENAFRQAILEGKSIDEAFGAAFDANVDAAGGPGQDGRVDFLDADLFIQGFDPGLEAIALINSIFAEADIATGAAEGTISSFNETTSFTTGNDTLSGGSGIVDTQFFSSQGSSLGGADTVDGGGGTDELTFQNLDDILIVGTFGVGAGPHNFQGATRDGLVTNTIEAINIEQFFFAQAGGNVQRLVSSFDAGGIAFALTGTSGSDTLNAFGDGTDAADLIFGSISLDVDAAFGALIFGGNGNDTITTSGNGGDLIFGGSGDDIIVSKVGSDTIQGGDGDDVVIVGSPGDFFKNGNLADGVDQISGGSNSASGDTLQIGIAGGASGQNFISAAIGDSVQITGIENLDFAISNTTFHAFGETFLTFTNITAATGVSDVTLVGAGGNLNLSTLTNVTSAVSTLTAIPTFGSGARVVDVNDNIGRTLVGTTGADTLTGLGGNDIFQMGGGRDTLSGGDGDDTFEIAIASDITSGINLSGGAGSDTLVLTSTSITSLDFPLSGVSFATLESFDLSGGAASGVSVTMTGNDLRSIPQFVGDGTTDAVNVFTDSFDARGLTFNGIEKINLTETGTFQRLEINGSTSITGLDVISGTVDGSGNLDDAVGLLGSRDFSGITFTDINEIRLEDVSGARQTIGANASSLFGLTEIGNFTGGSASTTDQFDYKSNLVSGDGTSVSASSDFTLTEIDSGARATNVISANSTGVIDFETTVNTNNLGIDITNSSLSQITTAVEALLESTDASINLTGSSAQMTQGAANTDSLLIFYDNDEDAVIIRYQEGATSEADFSGELSVLAIFDNPSGVSTFDDVNII